MKNEKIAIIGYASRLPQTSDATFWEDLLAGRNLLTRVAEDRWAQYGFEHPSRAHPGSSVTFAAGSLGDVGGFDAGFFRISPREAAAMDPQQRLLLEMSWEAFAHAGIPVLRLRGSRCGVFIGLASTIMATAWPMIWRPSARTRRRVRRRALRRIACPIFMICRGRAWWWIRPALRRWSLFIRLASHCCTVRAIWR